VAILIDASILIAWERGRFDLPTQIAARRATDINLSVITASEYGVARAVDPALRSNRSQFVEQILAQFPLVPMDLDTARVHAQIWADLDQAGTPIGRHDAWIAATCLQYAMSLVTANEREFRRVPGLVVENWLQP
jgi:tRNA(fMet)-specific endonuclease VapC